MHFVIAHEPHVSTNVRHPPVGAAAAREVASCFKQAKAYAASFRAMRANLLAWQWEQYPNGHRDRLNLLIHAATMPLFGAGVLLALAAPWLGPMALAGVTLLPLAMAMQGRGHR